MVDLGNPYDRARPSSLLTVPVLFGAAYLVSRYTGFLFIYQYTLSILMTILLSYFTDREMISRRRIFGGEFSDIRNISIFLYPALLAAALTAVRHLFPRTPVLYRYFTSGGAVLRGELFVLMMVVAVPAAELLFRGVFQRIFMDLFGKVSGSIASAAAYGIFFFLLSGNALLASIAAAIGALLSYIYYRERTVIATIIGHEIIVLAMFIFRF